MNTSFKCKTISPSLVNYVRSITILKDVTCKSTIMTFILVEIAAIYSKKVNKKWENISINIDLKIYQIVTIRNFW